MTRATFINNFQVGDLIRNKNWMYKTKPVHITAIGLTKFLAVDIDDSIGGEYSWPIDGKKLEWIIHIEKDNKSAKSKKHKNS